MANTEKHIRKVGNTLLPLNVRVKLNNRPVDLSAYTVTFRIEEEETGAVIQAGAAATSQPTQVFTAASTGLATCNGHGVEEGEQVIVANSGGTLPGGLATATRYYAVNVTDNAFGLATLPGGQSVIASAGSGTHTFYIVGSMQYDFAAGDVDAVVRFRAWVIFTTGAETHHFPDDGHIPIEIQSVGN